MSYGVVSGRINCRALRYAPMKPFAQSLLPVRDFYLRYRKWLIAKAVAKLVLATAIMYWWS